MTTAPPPPGLASLRRSPPMRPTLRALVLALLSVCATAGRDFYQTLGIDRGANEATIKRNYRNLAKKWHPDKNPGAEEAAEAKFREVGHTLWLPCVHSRTRVDSPLRRGDTDPELALPETERCVSTPLWLTPCCCCPGVCRVRSPV
jgi:hypothetical protein